MGITVSQGVELARIGKNPSSICRMPSGWAVLCTMQYLSGYTILLPDPVVGDLNALDRAQRTDFLNDMAVVGDALLDVTGAYRINYAIMGNSDQALHAHIVPRFMHEPDELRQNQPWAYASEVINSNLFDAERDRDLIFHLAQAIQKRL